MANGLGWCLLSVPLLLLGRPSAAEPAPALPLWSAWPATNCGLYFLDQPDEDCIARPAQEREAN